jgi:prepilin-type N-terminal cleavage/methylation domain-containing protein
LQHPIIGNIERGFTLVEVMVSLVAMAIGFVLLWGLLFSSLRMEMIDHRRTQAVEIARRNLEILRTQNTVSGNACPDTTGLGLPSFDPASSTCRARVDPSPLFPSWQRTVTVTIKWRERAKPGARLATADNQTVEMVAVYSDHLNQ